MEEKIKNNESSQYEGNSIEKNLTDSDETQKPINIRMNDSNRSKYHTTILNDVAITNVNLLPKIFVGNVPFQCANEEFKNCFKNIPGFVDAEIINRHNSDYSRGFGFVTLKTIDHAKKLLPRNDVIFKGRILRFADYNFSEKNIQKQKMNNKNYLFIKNIPKHMKRIDLMNIFKTYGDVGGCFLMTNIKTGESKGNGIIEIKNDNLYETLLNKKYFKIYDNTILEVSKWKNKIKVKTSNRDNHNFFTNVNNDNFQKNNHNNIDAKEIYRLAFEAGLHVGLKIAHDENTEHKINLGEPYHENLTYDNDNLNECNDNLDEYNLNTNTFLCRRNEINKKSVNNLDPDVKNFCENFILKKNTNSRENADNHNDNNDNDNNDTLYENFDNGNIDDFESFDECKDDDSLSSHSEFSQIISLNDNKTIYKHNKFIFSSESNNDPRAR